MKIYYGTTRTVFLIGKYAIKIPRFWHKYSGHRWKTFLCGILDNISENQWWKSSGKEDKDKLCPVLYFFPFGFLLIMERAKKLNNAEYDKKSFHNKFKYFPLDNKITNFGKINNKIVLIDYGYSR